MAAVPEPPPPPGSDSSASRSSPADVEDDVAEIYLRFIVRASELLAAPETLQSLLSGLMDLLLEILPADAAALFQLDDRGELHPAVVRIAKWEGAGDPPPPVSQSILRKVLKDKMGWFAPQTAGDKDFNPEKSAAWLPVQSAVCAPLLGEKGVEGMIFLGRGQHYSPFIAKELDLCLALGGQLSGAVSRMKLQEQVRSAAAIRSSLERFIPSEVANRMVSQSGQLGRGLDLEEREVTVLVAKVANYRQLASRLDNLRMARALDVILGELADIVFRYRGTVVAFTQKGMLAVFGAPAAHTTDCDRAFEAALAVQSAGTGSILPELGKIEYGVALAHGIAAAGAIGSQRRLEYVVIGEPVDRARSIARLARPGKILLDQFLLDKLDDCDATPWEAPYTAEGQDPVQIYEVNVRP